MKEEAWNEWHLLYEVICNRSDEYAIAMIKSRFSWEDGVTDGGIGSNAATRFGIDFNDYTSMVTADDLPTQDDFDPWRGNPDAMWAHGVFGGLAIPDAIKKFQERPDIYQECFMFMGGKAFAYYFPVIEHHLYSVPNLDSDHEDWQDPCAWIVAKGIEAQFDDHENHNVLHLASRVIDLASFVQDNIHRFEDNPYGNVGRESVSDAWVALEKTIKSIKVPSPRQG